MKKLLVIIAVCSWLPINQIHAKVYVISNNYNAFSPTSVTIAVGDTVKFELTNTHNAVQVSKETYDKNDSVSNGGFRTPYSGGMVKFDTVGTYYFVCTPHAYLDMKGIIVVKSTTTKVNSINGNTQSQYTFYPNPTSDFVNVKTVLNAASDVSLHMYDMTGKLIQQYFDKDIQAGEFNRLYSFEKEIKPGKYIVELSYKQGSYSQIVVVK
jgi:plastocyanin